MTMNLEAVEQECLHYMRDLREPLVPVSRLLDRIARRVPDTPVSESDLAGFLGRHELFRIIEVPGQEPKVILRERIPSNHALADAMTAQLDAMANALEEGRAQALRNGDETASTRFDDALARTRSLRERIADAFR